MCERNVYSWEEIRRYFPPERVAEIRAEILELRKSKRYTDEELWKMYGMSERAFYELVGREKEGCGLESLRDKTSKPKNPHRKLSDEDKAEIVKSRIDDMNRIETAKLAFIEAMKRAGRILAPEKTSRLIGLMNKAVKGVRRLAAAFNRRKEEQGSSVRIGKSWVYHILSMAGLAGITKERREKKHLHRPEEPLRSFAMDYTERRIGTGEKVYAFGLLDMYNSGVVILNGENAKSGENVVSSLRQLREIIPDEILIEIRSDGGPEFDNEEVREYCNKHNIMHHILPKGHPWLNAFIERAMETLQYEYINLRYIGSLSEFQEFLKIAKDEYNNREHSSFGYRTPIEVWKKVEFPKGVTAGGLWT